MSKSKRLIIGLFLVVGTAAGLIINQSIKNNPLPVGSNTLVHFENRDLGISLDFEGLMAQAVPLTQQDKDDKLMLRLTEKDGDAKPFLITVRYDEGLAKAAAITKQPLLDHLENSAKLTIPKRAGYEQEGIRRITIGGKEAIEFSFRYNGLQNTLTKQQLLMIPIDADKALYIALQAKATDFDVIDQQTFIPLRLSVELLDN